MVWIRIDLHTYAHRHTHMHTYTAQRDIILLTQHFFLNLPRDKCLSKTLSKQQEICGKKKTTKNQILLHHCSSIHLVENSLFIYGTLKRVIWIMRGMTKGELHENNKMTTTPKPPEGTCQHIASVSSFLALPLWAHCSAGSRAHTHTRTYAHTHIRT